MSFLLDTNVVSEWVKPAPNPGVVRWLAETDEDRTFLSVLTLAEIRRGIEKLAAGKRKQRLSAWLEEELPERFEGRLLSVDGPIALAWGHLVARAEADGRGLSTMDGFFAATAQLHGLTLVTRNVKDFAHSGVPLLNPWQ